MNKTKRWVVYAWKGADMKRVEVVAVNRNRALIDGAWKAGFGYKATSAVSY
jgi:hypothetical protein